MTSSLGNVFSSPILAFLLGIFAVIIHSDLEIPRSISKFISLYLLFSIGFRGGAELAHSVWGIQTFITIVIGLVMSILTPIYTFHVVKRRFSLPDAGAIAASYGSISFVNFISAIAYLTDHHIPYGGHMVALMAVMECPAIIIGMLLIRIYSAAPTDGYAKPGIFQEVFRNGSIVMLLGSLVIGFFSSPSEVLALNPFITGLQKGMLVFFLLDMGLLVGKNMQHLKKIGVFMLVLGILIPLINAIIGVGLTYWFKIDIGDSLLLIILLASASYIAVPAAFRLTMPEADPSLYVTPALAITFPFNVVIGIPLYYYVLNYLASL